MNSLLCAYLQCTQTGYCRLHFILELNGNDNGKHPLEQARGCRQTNLGNGQCRTPLFLENVQANTAIAIDVGMKHLCSKCNLHSLGAKTKTSPLNIESLLNWTKPARHAQSHPILPHTAICSLNIANFVKSGIVVFLCIHYLHHANYHKEK